MSTPKSLDFLTKTHDHYPQLLGTFDVAINSVNIKIWNIVDGQNLEISLSNSGCYPIGNTGRWGWSTANLPIATNHLVHYLYMMIPDSGPVFDAQFILDIPEGAQWVYPNNQNTYLR